MRISTSQIFGIANNSITEANQEIAKTQAQLSTGQRVLTPSDDPVASTKILELDQSLARIEQYGKNINIAENNLTLEETTLQGVLNTLQRIREITVQAGNSATYTESEYKALAAEVDARLDELQNLLNTQNAAGDFIFGGYKGGDKPFTGTVDTGFQYNGDEGQVRIKVSESTSIATSDSGKAVFVDIPAAQNTMRTSASAANQSNPPATISIGQVVDQDAYDEFYPEDMVITFREDDEISPPGKNFTITERSTGNIIQPFQNTRYSPGDEFTVNGVSISINGNPNSGITVSPATIDFGGGAAFPQLFSANNATVDVTVNGVTETLVLDADVNNATDLANLLNNVGNGNATRLANLGIAVTAAGFSMPVGVNFTLDNVAGPGAALVNAAMDLTPALTGNARVTSTDGVIQEGDEFFIDSTPNQDVLTTLARFSDAMKGVDGSQESRDFLGEIVADTLNNINNAQTNILETTSDLGARLNTLESTKELHLDNELVSREILSDLRDLDYAEAASRLSALTLVLEAAQATFVRVSQLTLFSRL
jgi:flagellar hook-associated protein 3 FlgL